MNETNNNVTRDENALQNATRDALFRDYVYEKLNKINDAYDAFDKMNDTLHDDLKIDIGESPLADSFYAIADVAIDTLACAIKSHARTKMTHEEITDTLNWFFFEYKLSLSLSHKTMCVANAMCFLDDEKTRATCYDIASLCDYLCFEIE